MVSLHVDDVVLSGGIDSGFQLVASDATQPCVDHFGESRHESSISSGHPTGRVGQVEDSNKKYQGRRYVASYYAFVRVVVNICKTTY